MKKSILNFAKDDLTFFKYEKKDGTIRSAFGYFKKEDQVNANVVTYWDVVEDNFRSFRMNGLIEMHTQYATLNNGQ